MQCVLRHTRFNVVFHQQSHRLSLMPNCYDVLVEKILFKCKVVVLLLYNTIQTTISSDPTPYYPAVLTIIQPQGGTPVTTDSSSASVGTCASVFYGHPLVRNSWRSQVVSPKSSSQETLVNILILGPFWGYLLCFFGGKEYIMYIWLRSEQHVLQTFFNNRKLPIGICYHRWYQNVLAPTTVVGNHFVDLQSHLII